MSMSTGDVRRPSFNKLSKAVADDKPEAEILDEEIDLDESEDVEEADAEEADEDAPEADAAPSPAKAKPLRATPASTKATPGSAKAAPASAKAAPGSAKAAPAKSAAKAAPGKSATATKTATKAAAKTTTPTKARPSAKTAPAGRRPVAKAGGGGGKGRRTGPIKVNQGPNWGPIAMFGGAGVVALLIIGFGALQLIQQANQPSWQERAKGIDGISNYLETNKDWFVIPEGGNHKAGVLTYPTTPPVGGIHNGRWQNCMGDVYDGEIAKEHATHSLEHGAVWITYRPDLPKNEIDALAAKVSDQPFMLMSPYPGQDKPISLQAWGFQLKVDNSDDDRIDEFIGALRQNATQEPQAGCSGGITDTSPTPIDLPETQQ